MYTYIHMIRYIIVENLPEMFIETWQNAYNYKFGVICNLHRSYFLTHNIFA